jgi:hypothetical protein
MTARADVSVTSYAGQDLSFGGRFARQKLLRFGLCCGSRIHLSKDHRDMEFSFLNSNIMAITKPNPHLHHVSSRSIFLIEIAEASMSSTLNTWR